MSTVIEAGSDARAAAAAPQFIVLFPAYEPGRVLIELVNEVLRLGATTPGFAGVVVVNDGSKRQESLSVIEILESNSAMWLITHSENRGKGGALKTGFSAIYEQCPHVQLVVTADADGQHTPLDIFRVAAQAQRSGLPNIGYRSFTNEVPLRSRVGNLLTAALFRMATGKDIKDTQSGLRTYRREDLRLACGVAADRYDFEFHCLFQLAQMPGLSFDQVPIETIYEPGNPTSHFNPLIDSLRIYAVFFRYVSVSAISGTLDFLLFSVFTAFGAATLVALVCARAVTAPIYFLGMRNVVFKSKGNPVLQAFGTVALMVFHILFLWQFINWMKNSIGIHPVVAMLAGLLTFYVGIFLVQRFVIYRFKPRS